MIKEEYEDSEGDTVIPQTLQVEPFLQAQTKSTRINKSILSKLQASFLVNQNASLLSENTVNASASAPNLVNKETQPQRVISGSTVSSVSKQLSSLKQQLRN